MTVVDTIEFNAHQERYLDMAMDDHLIIQRGQNMLIVQNFVPHNEQDMIFEPDEDFYRSITLDELRESAHDHIHRLFTNK